MEDELERVVRHLVAMYDDNARLDRKTALMLWTRGSAWFSSEQGKKGQIKAGQLADLVILSKDYFSVIKEEIKGIESVLTVADGEIVYAAGGFSPLSPPPVPVLPEWSPSLTCRNTIAAHRPPPVLA